MLKIELQCARLNQRYFHDEAAASDRIGLLLRRFAFHSATELQYVTITQNKEWPKRMTKSEWPKSVDLKF